MSGNVIINIIDGGGAAVSVPGTSTQLVIGCSSAGTVNQVVATKSTNTLTSTLGYGPLVEAAGLSVQSGGTVLAMRVPVTTAGTATTPVTAGTGTALANVAVTFPDTASGAYDDYYVSFVCVTGGALGTAGITFKISLDAGRTYGPILRLGTALSYVIPNTNVSITLGLITNTYVAGDSIKFATTAMKWQDSDILSALNAFYATPYGGTGAASVHIVGVCAGSDVSAIAGFPSSYLETQATKFLYLRSFFTARDVHTPAAWGGASPESETTWMNAIELDFQAVSAKRACVGAGYYNTPTAFPTTAAGTPSYRRPLSWSAAARQVTIPPQRHLGRVSDGPLSLISVNPSSDPTDGFIYHDESVNPGLDYLFSGVGTSKFMAATTRKPNLPGYYITNPLLSSATGSDFYLMPFGSVMDVACDIVHQVGQLQINNDVRLTLGGTLYINDALAIQNAILVQLNALMTGTGMISGASVVVDLTNNVRLTNNVNIEVTINAKGYILSETVNIGFNNPSAA